MDVTGDSLPAEVEGLAASRRRIVRTAMADRHWIERELHDGVQQDLVALVVNLQRCGRIVRSDPVAAATLLDEIRKDAQAALEATRRLALLVYPPLLDSIGLRAALRSAAAEVTPAATIDVSLDTNCPDELAAAAYFCCLDLLERLPGIEAIDVRQDQTHVVLGVVAQDRPADLSSVKDRLEAFGGRLAIVTEGDARIRITCLLQLP